MIMDYPMLLRESARKARSIACFGLDPDISKIPLKGRPGQVIPKFYIEILSAMNSSGVMPACVKPNIAFYEQYGIEGLEALKKIIGHCKRLGVMVILDAKRGDIGKTSTAYAISAFRYWGADAVTVAPYMGHDSVSPFLEFCKEGKGVYVLDRTSNPGSSDFQALEVSGRKLFMVVSEAIVRWHVPGICAVVGATSPAELSEVSDYFYKSGKEVPLLIPGVGSQGGRASEVMAVLKKAGNDMLLHRINSSSAISYAYERMKNSDYAESAVHALRELNSEIGISAQTIRQLP